MSEKKGACEGATEGENTGVRKKAARKRRYDGLKYGWLKDAEKFLLLLLAVFLVFRFVIGVSFVKGNSMEPTLYSGEFVLYTRLVPEYQTGDVVSVKIPSGEYYVKRVIATAGDTVDIREGKVYVNGQELSEPYIQGITEPQEGSVQYPMTLEEGQVFILGDNRPKSVDSRTFGVVGERQIKGKLVLHVGTFSS